MQFNQESLNTLCLYLQETLSPDATKRKQAEASLKQVSTQPGFSLLLLRSLEVTEISDPIRQAGAIFFKNLVKTHWPDAESAALPPNDREQIKSNIVTLMLGTQLSAVQKQLLSSLEIISQHDFPFQWKNLLPELIERLKTQDMKMILSVLRTIHSVLKRYGHAIKSPEVLQELQYILGVFQEPLLNLLKVTNTSFEQNKANPDVVKPILQVVKILLKIYYLLNAVDLPEYFEDHINEIMPIFRSYLIFETKAEQLVGDEDDDKPGVLHVVQASVSKIINLYTEKYEEEFSPFLKTFLQDVWQLLMRLGIETKYDEVVIAGILFLSTLATGVHHTFFSDPEVLRAVCEKIVIPNLRLRELELELFEDNPVEFIRRDIEGSDNDTRRRSATELVKSLRKYYERETTEICAAYLTGLLQQYTSAPAQQWIAKDVAIYLVTALAARSGTAAHGTTLVNPLVPVEEFFAGNILPELQTPTPAALILKADALKFIFTFRQQLPKSAYSLIAPLLVPSIVSPNYVVSSYAAHCLERLLTVREDGTSGGVLRFGQNDLKPILTDVLTNLFRALETGENEYLIKCVMRVCLVAQSEILPFSAMITQALVVILSRVYQNPTNPSFNHYLFETLATLTKITTETSAEASAALERLLLEPFIKILQADVQEFIPYVFQILSMLLETQKSGISPTYFQILPPLLSPSLWERTASIPPLVRLLQAYLQRGGAQIVQAKQLEPILGIFQKLIASKTNDHEGFKLVESIILYIRPEDFTPYLKTLFTLILTRLSRDKTTKLIKSLLLFLSLFIGKYGATFLIQQIDSIQPNLFANMVESFWLPNIQKVGTTKVELKTASVGMTKMLVDPAFQVPPYSNFWIPLLTATVAVLELPVEQPTEENEPIDDFTEYDFSSAFVPLAVAKRPNNDPFPEIASPQQFLAQSLYTLFHEYVGKFPSLLQSLPQQVQDYLMAYFKSTPLEAPYIV